MSKVITAKQYRLLSMPHAQCRVYIKRFDDGGVSVELISYATSVLIANYHPDSGAELFCSGTYSPTTSRHINRFTRELFGDSKYYECKSALSDPDKYVGGYWYRVCDVDPERLQKMCERYEYEWRCICTTTTRGMNLTGGINHGIL
jgi:hypothetical protein